MNEENIENNAPFTEEQNQQIIDTGIVASYNAPHDIRCLTVIGQIEGHYILPPTNKTTKYEHIIPALVAIEEDSTVEGLLIVLNTVGGDVEAGLAIAELIAGMSKPTVSIVVGGGHSIGVPLAVSAKESFIVPSATMTIHPVRMNGMVLGVPQTMHYFEKMQERITRFITSNSRMKPERFRELLMERDELVMDFGTVLDGKSAVKEGLIDHLGSLSDAVNRLYKLIEKKNAAQQRAAQKNSKQISSAGKTVSKTSKTSKSGKTSKTSKTSVKQTKRGTKQRSAAAYIESSPEMKKDWRGDR